MGALRLTSLLIGLAVGLGACEQSQKTPQQTTAPLGAPAPAAPDLAPPPPPQGAFLAQLAPEQTAQLTSFGVEVVVPGVVPPNFTAAEIRGRAATSTGPDGGAAYTILYQDPSQRCFAIEFASSGIGDPPATEKRLPIKPPLFADKDYGLNYGHYQDPAMRAKFSAPELYTDWLVGKSGAYRLVGASYINSTFPNQGKCQDISLADAQKIVESLTVVAPAVIGDGQAPP